MQGEASSFPALRIVGSCGMEIHISFADFGSASHLFISVTSFDLVSEHATADR